MENQRGRQFVSFSLYRVEPEWRQLPKEVRQEDKEQLESITRQFSVQNHSRTFGATTMGLMAGADLMLFSITDKLDEVQGLATAIAKSEIGGYLTRQLNLVGWENHRTYQESPPTGLTTDKPEVESGLHRYLFVYPVKMKHEWYRLPLPERQELLDEQILIAAQYPKLQLNTASSFGLNEQDFIVMRQCENPHDFMELMQELRETRANSYSQNEAPMLTGIHMHLHEVLNTLG